MCNPVAIAVIGAAAAATAGARANAQAGAQADAQGKLNQKLNDIAAQDAILRGDHEQAVMRMKVSQTISKQRTAYATSGVDVDQGSAVDVQAMTAGLGEVETREISTDARREAWGYKVKGLQERFQGDLAKKAYRDAAISSILGGGVNIAGILSRK